MKLKQKLWLLAITVTLLTVLFALCASAEVVGGDCGKDGSNVTWSFDTETGHFTLSGTGATATYGSASNRPWHSYAANIKTVTVEEGITEIGQRVFTSTAITSIVLPDSLTKLVGYTFSSCTSLTDVTFGSGLIEIGQYTFSGCSALTSITVPSNVTTIGNFAFNICKKLTDVTLEEGIQTIGGSAFYGCTALKELEIPFSVTTIGSNNSSAFVGCTALTDVTFLSPGTAIQPAGSAAAIPEGVTIHGLANSTAETYATTHSRSFVVEAPFVVDGGTCGDSVTWTLTSNGALTLSGSGKMANYATASDAPWHSYRASITSIAFEGNITSIGDRAFYGFSIRSIVIPDSVTSIGYNGFSTCKYLTSVTIGSGVTGIGTYGFQQCTSLESIVIPGNVTTVGTTAFNGCKNLKSVTLEEGVQVIEAQAFNSCTALTEIVLPSTVTRVGNSSSANSAFSGCTSLTDVTFLSAKTTIYPASATAIPATATIHSLIGSTAATYAETYGNTFEELTVLSGVCGKSGKGTDIAWSLDLATGHLILTGTGETAAYSSTAPTPWYPYADKITSVTIGDGITVLGARLLWSTKITSVVIPDSVTTINGYVFSGCSSLSSVSFGSGVISIKEYAFSGCKALESITIPGTLTTLGNYVFNVCTSLKTVIIEEGVETISNNGFNGCSALTEITFPSTMTQVGNPKSEKSVFAGCSALTKVTFLSSDTLIYPASAIAIPEGVTIYGYERSEAEAYATAYNRTFVPLEAPVVDSGVCGENLTWTFTADGLLTISGYGNMTKYTSNEAVPWHQYRASITALSLSDQMTSISARSFGSTSITEVVIPDSVTTMGGFVFNSCKKLSSITIGSGVTSMGEYTFAYCTSIESVVIPGNVKSFGSWVFAGCTSLSSIVLGEGIETMANNFFDNCDALTSVTLPASLTRIGQATSKNSIFSNCDNLASVTFLSPNTVIYPSIENTGANAIPANTTIYGYAGSTAAAYASTYNRTFVALNPFSANDCTTVFTVTGNAIAAPAGEYLPVVSIARTFETSSETLDLLFVDSNSALYIQTANGEKIALADKNGHAYVLSSSTTVSIVYNDETGLARFYVNGLIPFCGKNTPAINVAIASESFCGGASTSDLLIPASGVSVETAVTVDAAAEFAGFQVGTDSTKIRILAGVDSLYYDGIGFEVSLYSNGKLQKTISSYANKVFTSIIAAGDPVSAEECGFEYLTALVIEGIDRTQYPSDAVVYFTLKTFTTIGDEKLYGEEKTIIITYDAANRTHMYALGDPIVNEPGQIVLRFIAASDVHITDSGATATSGAGKLKNAIDQVIAYFADPANNGGYAGLDAVALAGDIVNTGTDTQYEHAKNFFASALPEGTELVITMGNHDWGNNSALTYEEALVYLNKFETVFGPATRDVVIGGYHFITINGDERLDAKGDNGANMKRPYGYDYSEETLAYATQLIEAAVADTPDKPIFVIQHVANSDTIGGSLETVTKADGTTLKGDTSDSAVPTLLDLQNKYSNLIVISGHSHFPANDVASIHQKHFTAINTGVLGGSAGQSRVDGNKLSDMDDSDPNVTVSAGNNDDVFVIEVDSNNVVTIRVWDGASASFIGETWVVDSFDPDFFRYTEDRFDNDDIFFAEDATITEELVASTAITVKFPSVAVDSVEARVYKLIATSKVTGNQVIGYVVPEYYNISDPITITATLSGLESNADYTLEVYALNPLYSFDIASKDTIVSDPLSLTFKTRREGGPDIIQFEIDAENNVLKNLVPAGLAPNTAITPNAYFDPTVGMNVVSFDGTNESAIDFANYGNAGFCDTIADGMTFETYIRVDELPASSFAGLIASCQNSGGFGLFVNSKGEFAFRYNNGESGSAADERWLYYPISVGVYYHFVAVYDGAGTLTLYVNGTEVASDTTITRFRVPDSNYSRRFYMGADVLNSTSCQSPSKCTVANFGLYSKPLTAEEIQASYKAFRMYAPKTPDLISLAFDSKTNTTINAAENGLPITIKGTIATSYDPTLGMDVASFTHFPENTSKIINNIAVFDLNPVNDILVDGMTFEA